jgi:hypothetical protein
MSRDDKEKGDGMPPGWDYNPASWPQRLPIVGAAAIGFLIAMYLALYQWGVFDRVFEPFFGTAHGWFGGDSRRILQDSSISRETMRLLGVPDAFLGALGYLADTVAGVIGGTRRWRTMPWIVILFGLLVGPFGLVSLLLVVAQPVFYHGWCTLCLCSAAISVLMIGPAMDETLASCQHLKRVRAGGGSPWRAFWGLSTAQPESGDTPSGEMASIEH